MVFKDNYPPIPGPLNPADPIFKYLHILKFKDIYNLKILKFVYKWIHMLIPKNFDNSFIRNRDVHNNDTRYNVQVVFGCPSKHPSYAKFK